MTEDEARALAVKREAHKSKHMTAKRWAAVHTSVKGWHVALIDNHAAIYESEATEARRALNRGDVNGYVEHGAKAVVAGVRAILERNP